jgi:hypothetical protein
MKLEDIFTTEQVVLEETKIYEQADATDFDKETKHVHRVLYDPAAFKAAFATIIEDDAKYPTREAKLKAIRNSSPFWNQHLGKVTRRKETGDRRQKTGDRRQKTGDRRQKTEDRRQKTEDRRQETGDRRQETRD